MEQCRLCLTSTNQRICVTDNLELIEKIKEVATIEITVEDRHTKFVCLQCIRKIENWHAFKVLCLNSKTFLESISNIEENRIDAISLSSNNEKTDQLTDTDDQDSIEIKEVQLQAIIEKSEEKSQLYTCDFCNREFDYFLDYLDHQETHDGQTTWSCTKCKETFTNRIDLHYHEKNHKFPCQICGTLVLPQSMKLHLNMHTDRFKCKLCDMKFTCASLLRTHIDIRHKNLKNYFCETCGKNFGTKTSLTLHAKTHSDKKEYKCDECSYAGKTSIGLRIHISKHEKGTYICEYCSSVFKSNRNLKDHLRRVHQDRKYACDICSMRFGLRYLVEQHKRTHTGIQPYSCGKCDKSFARSDGLKEHQQIHGRRETFKCEPCAKEFKTKRGLRRHNCTLGE
ncbi:unnamed protein product [Ceutorhynchus assimilis]|uniref:Uncharacterized protein n=1 Tax=Ceutorhynchus assimilis TaxID=467358 RepID=A0A9N9MM21_9CUCU|nr:unnamed protein product [Ceutorhynchus assimilis]